MWNDRFGMLHDWSCILPGLYDLQVLTDFVWGALPVGDTHLFPCVFFHVLGWVLCNISGETWICWPPLGTAGNFMQPMQLAKNQDLGVAGNCLGVRSVLWSEDCLYLPGVLEGLRILRKLGRRDVTWDVACTIGLSLYDNFIATSAKVIPKGSEQ